MGLSNSFLLVASANFPKFSWQN